MTIIQPHRFEVTEIVVYPSFDPDQRRVVDVPEQTMKLDAIRLAQREYNEQRGVR